jgi:ribosomal protein S18 acetylase RimI-like enzyme
MKLRRAVLSDAGVLAIIEQTQPQAAGWGKSGFESELKLACSFILCAEQETQLVGFVAARFSVDSAEIENLAVLRGWERRGIGKQLLAEALLELKEQGVEQISLEVAKDNSAACALYQKAGFIKLGERKDFYGPGHAAWLLGKKL